MQSPPAQGDAEFQIDLNSYEENQFRWAEDSVAEGSLKDAEEGRGVMAVTMDAARDFTPGEEITIDFPSGAETVTVSGVLNGRCVQCYARIYGTGLLGSAF